MHWISYAIDPRLKLIYLLDPLKQRRYTGHYADAFTALLQRRNMTDWRLAFLPLKLQQDSHNCGIWCVWLSGLWQEYVMSNSQMPFTQYAEQAYHCLPATRSGNVEDRLRRQYFSAPEVDVTTRHRKQCKRKARATKQGASVLDMTADSDDPKAVQALKKSCITHHAHTKSSRRHRLHAGKHIP